MPSTRDWRRWIKSRNGGSTLFVVGSNLWSYNICCRLYTITVEKDQLQAGPFFVQQTHPQADDWRTVLCHTESK